MNPTWRRDIANKVYTHEGENYRVEICKLASAWLDCRWFIYVLVTGRFARRDHGCLRVEARDYAPTLAVAKAVGLSLAHRSAMCARELTE